MAKIRFINVDLDVSSLASLGPLTKAVEKKRMVNLRRPDDADDTTASYELVMHVGSANETISRMLDVLEQLKGEAKEAWLGATRREFDIGYDCGTEPLAFNEAIDPDVVRRIALIGAGIRITLYPERDNG